MTATEDAASSEVATKAAETTNGHTDKEVAPVKKEEDSKPADEETKPADVDDEAKKTERKDPQDKATPTAAVKKEDTVEAADTDDETIRLVGERLRFFFSNANLRSDRYMRSRMRDNDGAVPLVDLLRFRTVKSLTERAEDVLRAAEKKCADLVKPNEKRDGLVRADDYDFHSTPNPEEARRLSVVVSGLPTTTDGDDDDGHKKYDVTVADVVECFGEDLRPVLVRLRFDHPSKSERKGGGGGGRTSAKGNAFAEFNDEDAVKKVLEKYGGDDDGKKLKIKDQSLTVVAMTTWHEEREKKRKEENGGGSGFKKRSREENDNDDGDEPTTTPVKPDYEKGPVVSLKGLPDGCDREAILAAVEGLDYRKDGAADAAAAEEKENAAAADGNDDDNKKKKRRSPIYVDYSRGQKDGAVRFPPLNDVTCADKLGKIVESLKNGQVTFCGGTKVEDAVLLQGEEEEKYWKAFEEFKRKKAKQQEMRRGGGFGRGGGRGGRGGRGFHKRTRR